jgi:hypothetical protein
MAVDSDFLLAALLCHNYLPTSRRDREELPPNFSSSSFSPVVARKLADLEVKKNGRKGFDQIEYRLTRFNTAGRWLSIPHPLPHAKLCLKLTEHWGKFAWIQKNTHSNIKPQRYEDGRAIVMNGYSDSSEKTGRHLSHSFGKRYVVHADVSNFFPSLYSHAIPWALVGFDEAKEKSGHKLNHRDEWFNQIDACVRHTKRDETQGVAIGPATSNILGEIILGKVDEALAKSLDGDFSRYIDDYSYYCDSEDGAKKFLHSLECELAKFKLHLNAKKTSIEKLPQPTVEPWVIELGQSKASDKDKEVSLFDVYRYLDFAQVLSAKHPEGSVLKYAVSTVIKMPIRWDQAGDLLQYLLSLSFHHTNLLPLLEKPIEKNHAEFIGYSRAGADLISILAENVSLKRSDGICWALYFLGRLEHHVPEDLAKKIVGTGDCMSILSLYWAAEEYRQLVVDYANSIDRAHLYELDRHWMLFYQLFFDRLMDSPYEADPTFQILRDEGVSFLLDRTPYTGALAMFSAIPQAEPK